MKGFRVLGVFLPVAAQVDLSGRRHPGRLTAEVVCLISIDSGLPGLVRFGSPPLFSTADDG